MGYVCGHRNSHRTSRIWAPPSTPPRLLWPRGMLLPTSTPSSTRCWRNSRPWRARSQHGAGRSRHWPEQPCARRSWRSGASVFAACSSAPSASCATSRSARCTRCSPAGPVWRRLLNRLIQTWRQACGDTPEPSAVIVDSCSCPSAPSCFGRGCDGGKKIKGIKIHLAVDKYGFPLAITVSTANVHDSKGIIPVLHQLAGRGFKGTALGDLSYRGQRLTKVGEALGITLQPSAGGHGGTFIPEGIRWVVERSLAWMSTYRRLNTMFDPTKEPLVAFIEIAFISILSRRLVRLVTQEISA